MITRPLTWLAASAWMAAEASDPKPCTDATAWANFEQLRQSTAGKPIGEDVEYLYQYRIFLCQQIDAGRLTEAEANPLFEAEHQRLLKRIKRALPAEPG